MAKMRFYFDEMMPRPAANELIKRGYEVIMAVDVGMTERVDEDHLKYATADSLVLVTEDRAFAGRAANQMNHSGVICWIGTQGAIGPMVRSLSEFAEQHTAEAMTDQVFWLK